MATLPRDFRVHSNPSEHSKDSASAQKIWPPEVVSLVVLLTTVATCFIVVWTGLALVSWHVINMRGGTGTMSDSKGVSDNGGVTTHRDNWTMPNKEYGEEGDEDRIIDWPGFPEGSPAEEYDATTTPPPRPASPSATDAELSQLAQQLWDADINRFPDGQYTLHLQGHTNQTETIDRAPRRLFNSMTADPVTWSGTFTRFVSLLNNYELNTRTEDEYSMGEKAEIDGFLDAILRTDVVRYLEDFLMRKGYIGHGEDALRQLLKSLWFEMYNRSPKYTQHDSSGFEHVFAGELKKNRVTGFHSWVRFYLEERDGNIDYQGYISYDSPGVINVRMLWHGKRKKQASFFMGTSPEFDMSIYTLCVLARTNSDCNLSINQAEVPIKSFDVSHVEGLQVGTAFPAV